MKIKKEYLILVLLIIGLSVYLFTRTSDRTHYDLPVLAKLDPAKITKIEISKDGHSMVLTKKTDQWYIEPKEYLVDKNRVNSMLAVFENLSLAALVSESKDYQRYDLHPEKRITAKAYQDDIVIRHLDIGKAASSFRHTFVKLDDDDRVFHATDNFRDTFDQTTDDLRDRGVLSFQVDDIQSLQVTQAQNSLDLMRKEMPIQPAASSADKSDAAPPAAAKYEWQDSNGKSADDRSVNRLLTTLGSLKCARYIEDQAKEAFSGPIYTVKLRGTQEHQLEIFDRLEKDEEHYPAVSSGSDYAFLLSNNQAKLIMKDPEEMIKKPEGDESANRDPT